MSECPRCDALVTFITGQLLVELRRVMEERDAAAAQLRILRIERELP